MLFETVHEITAPFKGTTNKRLVRPFLRGNSSPVPITGFHAMQNDWRHVLT